MTAFAILGFVFGLTGFVFGLVGFILATTSVARLRRLERQMGTLQAVAPAQQPAALGTGEAPRSLYPGLAAPASLEPVSVGERLVPGELASRVRDLVADGRKINAVKEVRDQTGLGLKEAVDLVEALERRG